MVYRIKYFRLIINILFNLVVLITYQSFLLELKIINREETVECFLNICRPQCLNLGLEWGQDKWTILNCSEKRKSWWLRQRRQDTHLHI